jgi:hypothetical protein
MLNAKRLRTLLTAAAVLVPQPLLSFSQEGAPLSGEVVMKAEADECYNGIGGAYVDKLPGVPCDDGWLEKRNQSYGWSLADAGGNVWLGTGANISCIAATAGSIFSGETVFFQAPPGQSSFAPDGPFPSAPPFTGSVGPGGATVTAGDYVLACEGAESQYLYEQFPRVEPLISRLTGSIFGLIGDWRPPEVWVHDASMDEPNQLRVTVDDPRINLTLGLRAAGALDGVVLMAGPSVLGIGLQVFAFDAATLELIGARTFARYSNVRRFIVLRNDLYVGVQTTDGAGAVLRWTGNRQNPIRFQTVGKFDTEVAQLATFNDRLVATTWPPSQLSSVAGFLSGRDTGAPSLWISPRAPFFGLRPWNAYGWRKLWDYADYEPDPVIRAYSGLGDLLQFGSCVYFGSMHPPGAGALGINQEYDDADLSNTSPAEIAEKSYRSLAVFRWCANAGVEVLYGEAELPVFTPGVGWSEQPTGMGAPKYGALPGADAKNQNYFWSMALFDEQLCFGTQETTEQFEAPPGTRGANLYCFPDTNSGASLIDQTGLGNRRNSGYRNILEVDGSLFLATSNGANLNPGGGFELIRLDSLHDSQ